MSLTIKILKFEIDCGVNKINVFNTSKRNEQLLLQDISKSSAIQRLGRLGRTQEGVCYRLYSKEEYETKFNETVEPEILRSRLDELVLFLANTGIDPLRIEYIDKPHEMYLLNTINFLKCHRALDHDGQITQVGKNITKIQIKTELAISILKSIELNCFDSVLKICCMLSTKFIFKKVQNNKQREAENKRKLFAHQDGDMIAFLNIYNTFTDMSFETRINWCKENFIIHCSLKGAVKLFNQLKEKYFNNNNNRNIFEFAECPICTSNIVCLKCYINIKRCLLRGYFISSAKYDGHKYKLIASDEICGLDYQSLFYPSPEIFIVYDQIVIKSRREYFKNVLAFSENDLIQTIDECNSDKNNPFAKEIIN
jgi:pre-mRNA-splicing factor ATP-dependent RNA helicase DHX15/PRP43